MIQRRKNQLLHLSNKLKSGRLLNCSTHIKLHILLITNWKLSSEHLALMSKNQKWYTSLENLMLSKQEEFTMKITSKSWKESIQKEILLNRLLKHFDCLMLTEGVKFHSMISREWGRNWDRPWKKRSWSLWLKNLIKMETDRVILH